MGTIFSCGGENHFRKIGSTKHPKWCTFFAKSEKDPPPFCALATDAC